MHLSATAQRAAAPDPATGPRHDGPGGAAGRRRGGNPRGNPDLNLAPRCGARARSGCPCRAPAMANGRCRMHGGRSTGPRTPEGMARMTAARTTHGYCTAAQRLHQRYVRTLVVRTQLFCRAMRLRQYLPVELAARLALLPAEFLPPEPPSPGAVWKNAHTTLGSSARGHAPCNSLPALRRASRAGRAGGAVGLPLTLRAAERLAARAEAASQAPWRQAIAVARAAKREARAATREAQAAKRTGPVRAKRGETNAVRQNPMQLSGRVGPAALGGSVGPRPGGSSGAGVVDCGGSGRGGGRQAAEGAALFRPTGWRGGGRQAAEGAALFRPTGAAGVAARAAALGGAPLAVPWTSGLRGQLAALFGPAAPPAGWRVPQAWPPTGGPGAAFPVGAKPLQGLDCMTRGPRAAGVTSGPAAPPSRPVLPAGGVG